MGIVTNAAKEVGIHRSTHYDWMEADPDYKQAVDSLQDIAIDFAESKLFEKINGVAVKKGETDDGEDIIYNVPPSDTAIIFYLKTKAKKRGYIERQEIDNLNDKVVLIEREPDPKNEPIG